MALARKALLGVVALLAFATFGNTQKAWAEGDVFHRCVSNDASNGDGGARLIEVLQADLVTEQPCKVIYRPEFDSETLGTVAWQNMDSVAACYEKADEVIRQLVDEGWTCTQTIKAETTTAQTAQDSELEANGPRPQFEDDIDNGTNFSIYPDLAPPSDDLRALIEADLNSLDARLDGRLQAMVAGYGDLNDDDVDDVLVLFTYQSPKPTHRQFLAAYMHDGEAYRLTATKPIGGYASDTADAKVETIDRGVVHLTLQAFEPGDESCCPSGRRTLALTLRDLEFVEIDANGPTR